MSSHPGLRFALAAAVVASFGDLLMLAVANAGRTTPSLAAPLPGALELGAAFGVVSIPLYFAGYSSASSALAPRSPGAARLVLVGGAAVAAIGTFIHGLTAILIQRDLQAATPAASPLEAVMAWGVLPLAAWSLATLGVLVASAAILWAALSRSTDLPRWWGWTNPAALTLAIAALAASSEPGRWYLVPAAPNLAHAAFFACTLVALRAR